MKVDFTFPFGKKVRPVEQTDRSRKKVFVLGVYASAVHAKWISPKGDVTVKALAVASEPNIFWRGEGAETIVGEITIPSEVGRLEPADETLNGPSGRALDRHFLEPLRLNRSDAWLCDLVPHTCLNKRQMSAIETKYDPIRLRHGLPKVTIPEVPPKLADDNRRREIIEEIRLAQPRLIVLLGDQPIKWFLKPLEAHPSSRLSDFTRQRPYGEVFTLPLDGKQFNFLLLVHPRQAAGLSSHSANWKDVHRTWTKNRAKHIKKDYLLN